MKNGGMLKINIHILSPEDSDRTDISMEKFIEILISDTGCGIPRENLNHIFNPFFTTREEGTGLGLAITKRIIEDHGGNISVESRQGEGTKFRIRLPLRN